MEDLRSHACPGRCTAITSRMYHHRGGRGRRQGAGAPRDCIKYKFLGKCDKEDCTFRHEITTRCTIYYRLLRANLFVYSPAYRECLPVPAGMTIGMVIGSGGCNLKQLSSIARCGVIVEKDKVRRNKTTMDGNNVQNCRF